MGEARVRQTSAQIATSNVGQRVKAMVDEVEKKLQVRGRSLGTREGRSTGEKQRRGEEKRGREDWMGRKIVKLRCSGS